MAELIFFQMRQSTICLLVKEKKKKKELLLAMKKRGFGAFKWNGVGGKLDFKKGDKNITDTAIRETEEEIGVKIKDFEKVAILNFRFPYKSNWDQDVHVFLVKKWKGIPLESEEMAPQWFEIKDIPFQKMWDDDKLWLPPVLTGKKLKAEFIFQKGEIVEKSNIKFLKKYNYEYIRNN